MRLEYLENIDSNNDELIRLYDFDINQAKQFRDILKVLIKSKRINLHELDFIKPVNGLKLSLMVGQADLGIELKEKASLDFICCLKESTWEAAIDLVEPFCKNNDLDWKVVFQWLYDLNTKIDFLFSPSGEW